MNPLAPWTNPDPHFTASNADSIFQMKYINLDYLFYKIYLFFHGGEAGGGVNSGSGAGVSAPGWWARLFGGGGNGGEVAGAKTVSFGYFGEFVKDIIYIIILFLITLIIYCIIRIFEIRKKEKEYMDGQIAKYAQKQQAIHDAAVAEQSISRNEAWVKVLKRLDGETEGDWRMAIIDADKMLDNLTEQMNLPGETLGDKLKSADRDRFKSLNQAWDAHNIRNKIAHEGSDFVLTKREADRAIALYEHVFREFGHI